MIDETYKPQSGRLSDRDITYLCVGDNPMISPFSAKQSGKPSFGLSSAGFDFRLGNTYYRQKEYTGEYFRVIDPLSEEDQSFSWIKEEAKDGEIIIYPGECLLTATMETIDMPDDIVATVLGKSTYARNNIIVNATPLEPGWRGVVTLELHNCSNEFPVKLRVGHGIAQVTFERMANPPARTYSNREVDGKYQDQVGVTVSK